MTQLQPTQLTERRREILRLVVEEYIATGEPVGSKALVERSGLAVSASTVRTELAELESLGLLTHPHTSAGRIPTESGYRFYAAEVLEQLEPRPQRFPLDLSADAQRDRGGAPVDDRDALAGDAPARARLGARGSRRQPFVTSRCSCCSRPSCMVVTITSTGGVAKQLFAFDEPVDPGLAAWANEYLNERVAGVQLGTHLAAPADRGPEPLAARAAVPRRAAAGVRRPRDAARAGVLRRRRRVAARRRARRRAARRAGGCSRCSSSARRCSS